MGGACDAWGLQWNDKAWKWTKSKVSTDTCTVSCLAKWKWQSTFFVLNLFNVQKSYFILMLDDWLCQTGGVSLINQLVNTTANCTLE